jgi:caffeoyl-CoA O-methyltransferase
MGETWRVDAPPVNAPAQWYKAGMHAKFTALTPELYEYVLAHTPPQDDVLRDLAADTAALGGISMMQVAVEQGALLTWLTRLLGVRFAVEVGTFTGYSAISIARGLAAGGRLLCCDVSEEWTAIARRAWTRAGLADRIELRLGPAIETLKALPKTPPIDLAFVDADKTSYRAYYEELLPRLAERGVIVFDNVLWGGSVADPSRTDESTVAIRELNDFIAGDPRVDAVMLPVADGITVVRRR